MSQAGEELAVVELEAETEAKVESEDRDSPNSVSLLRLHM